MSNVNRLSAAVRLAPARLLLPAIVAILSVGQPLPATAADQSLQLKSPDGRRQITAVRVTTPITLDGQLDDEVWRRAQPADGFVQAEPHQDEPATEPTEVRLAFDDRTLYIGVYCHDPEPSGFIVNDIHKDFEPGQQDSFEVLLDTFADRRNGFVFVTNPAGAKADTQIANEGREVNTSWDAVWRVEAKILSDGWSAELEIPFKTLRFEAGSGHAWGINFGRRIRRKNEVDYWSQVTRAYSIYRASLAGTLDGLPDVAQGRNLRIKPFVSFGAVRATGQSTFDRDGQVGVDIKYGVTPSLTLDVTVNPDFAQAEADEQQVNLTQFSLFYPEKREFFLENSGVFYFGDIPRNSRVTTRFKPPEEELLLFFSRRIGLTSGGAQIPLLGGARLTGRAAGFSLGTMTIQTRSTADTPATNYAVVRARRDILRNSDIGAIVLSRQSTEHGLDYNRVVGADANFRFGPSLSINSFLTRSMTDGYGPGQWSWKSSVGWEDNFLHTQYSLLSIGENFRNDLGYTRRTDIRKHFVDWGIRPRPETLRRLGIRESHLHFRINYYTDQSNTKVTVSNHIAHTFTSEGGGTFETAWQPRYERIFVPFKIHSGVVIPVGSYPWDEYVFVLETNHSRAVSGSARVTTGGFWSGHQRTALLSLVVRPSYRFSLETSLQHSDISLHVPAASFTTDVVTAKTSYSFSTNMFLDALLQYSSDQRQYNANIRFNLIHRPLSDFFIVFNEQRIADADTPAGRGLIVKYTHMLSF